MVASGVVNRDLSRVNRSALGLFGHALCGLGFFECVATRCRPAHGADNRWHARDGRPLLTARCNLAASGVERWVGREESLNSPAVRQPGASAKARAFEGGNGVRKAGCGNRVAGFDDANQIGSVKRISGPGCVDHRNAGCREMH
jgi:hypothetical protein